MKRTGLDSPKISNLAKLLDVPRYAAIGLLECLWHFTAKHAITGAVGKWSDAEIAMAVGWDGDAGKLVEALVGCRLLDQHTHHRLVVHDWHDHADESVRKTIKNRGLEWASIREPDGNDSESFPNDPETVGPSQSQSQSQSQSLDKPEPEPRPKPGPEGAQPAGCSNGRSADVAAVYEHYRTYHPRSAPTLKSASKEHKLIAARLAEGFTADDLKRAIDGCHASPFHSGVNDNGATHQGLDLICRDASHVGKFIETADNPPPASMSEKTARTKAAVDEFVRSRNGQ